MDFSKYCDNLGIDRSIVDEASSFAGEEMKKIMKERGIDEKAANSILIKVNQIGTLSETINLPKKWYQVTAFEIEIKKSFIRGMLRYSENTLKIKRRVCKL